MEENDRHSYHLWRRASLSSSPNRRLPISRTRNSATCQLSPSPSLKPPYFFSWVSSSLSLLLNYALVPLAFRFFRPSLLCELPFRAHRRDHPRHIPIFSRTSMSPFFLHLQVVALFFAPLAPRSPSKRDRVDVRHPFPNAKRQLFCSPSFRTYSPVLFLSPPKSFRSSSSKTRHF